MYEMAFGVETSNLACDCGTEFGTELDRSGENGKRVQLAKCVRRAPLTLTLVTRPTSVIQFILWPH